MSEFCFLHTDFLRLATPVDGLADAPGWLSQLAAEAVRSAARNVFAAAIQRQADFLFIAGSVTDSDADFASVVEWLGPEFERLRRSGVKTLVTCAPQHASELRTVCDKVLLPDEGLFVSKDSAGACQFSTTDRGHGETLCLARQSRSEPRGRLTYVAQPSVQPAIETDIRSTDGVLVLSAGATQGVGPHETLEFGCLCVRASVSDKEFNSEFIPTDVIRFASEDLHLSATSSTEQLQHAVLSASESLARQTTQTLIVDWCVDVEVSTDVSEVALLQEEELLECLRVAGQSGHRGVWPRRITFTDSSSLQISSPGFESVEELVEVTSGSVRSFEVDRLQQRRQLLQGEEGMPPSLVTGLTFLSRAA